MKFPYIKESISYLLYVLQSKIKICLAFIAISLISCNKYIDISPENSLTFKNGLKSELDIESALAGAGQILRDLATYNTDNQKLKGAIYDQSDFAYVSRQLSPLSNDESDWQLNYRLIAQANVVINFITKISMPEARKNYYLGQAKFYKAFSYYELVRQYGDCILMKDEVKIDPVAKSPWSEVVELLLAWQKKPLNCFQT